MEKIEQNFSTENKKIESKNVIMDWNNKLSQKELDFLNELIKWEKKEILNKSKDELKALKEEISKELENVINRRKKNKFLKVLKRKTEKILDKAIKNHKKDSKKTPENKNENLENKEKTTPTTVAENSVKFANKTTKSNGWNIENSSKDQKDEKINIEKELDFLDENTSEEQTKNTENKKRFVTNNKEVEDFLNWKTKKEETKENSENNQNNEIEEDTKKLTEAQKNESENKNLEQKISETEMNLDDARRALIEKYKEAIDYFEVDEKIFLAIFEQNNNFPENIETYRKNVIEWKITEEVAKQTVKAIIEKFSQ